MFCLIPFFLRAIRFPELVLAVVLMTMVGCAAPKPPAPQQTPPLTYDASAFTQQDVIAETDIFQLTESQTADFLNYYHAPAQAEVAGHKRLYHYLEEKLSGFDFKGQTYSADEALSRQAGNCLSLAILTTALADLVAIKVNYQRVNVAPIFRRYDDIMMLSSHVRSHVYDPNFVANPGVMTLSKPKIVIDYFPQRGDVSGSRVLPADFIAMFYQNLAADALIRQQYDRAFSLITKGLEISPLNPETLNMLAVLYSKTGQRKQAEMVYRYALNYSEFSTNSVNNYARLLTHQGRHAEAELIIEQFPLATDDNPYRWIDIAENALTQGHIDKAIDGFKRANNLAPYIHEAYFGLAKSYYRLGNLEQANEAMQLAHQYAYTDQEESLYQAKLRVLEQHDN